MQAVDALARVLQTAPPRLVGISDEDAARRPAAGGWAAKELVGHLIDSASNNHQRWVRALAAPNLEFPKYRQEEWVHAQDYATERWADLVNLWLLYNRHLLHVARQIPPEKYGTLCTIGDDAPVTLEALVVSYVEHLQHHLQQVLNR